MVNGAGIGSGKDGAGTGSGGWMELGDGIRGMFGAGMGSEARMGSVDGAGMESEVGWRRDGIDEWIEPG